MNRHVFQFNPGTNGGESLLLISEFEISEDTNNTIISGQELTLQSYCNSATFTLCGAIITPNMLRQLANELDIAMCKYESSKKETSCVN